jgi:hypothetical protein
MMMLTDPVPGTMNLKKLIGMKSVQDNSYVYITELQAYVSKNRVQQCC